MKNNTKALLYFFLILSVILSVLTVMAAAETKPSGLSARAAVLYEAESGSWLYEKNADEKLPMASTTKIMTAIIAIETRSLDEYITIPNEAVGIEGSSLYLKAGERLRVKDLVYSLLLRSANDAAACLAISIGGDIEGFSHIMNEKAQEIGMTGTSFVNPHGLDDPEHYTTAKDMALLSAYCLKNPVFREITSTYKYTFACDEQTRTVVNHNKLLHMYEGAIGVKTGYTKKSGRCLVGAAEREGLTLISVTLDAPSDWSDHKALFDYGFNTLRAVKPSMLTETEFTIPALDGKKESVKCSLSDQSPFIIGKDDVLNAKTSVQKYLIAPIKEGDTVGRVDFYLNGKLYETRYITVNEGTEKAKHSIFSKDK